MSAGTGDTNNEKAINYLRELIDEQASQVREVAELVEELFDRLYELELSLKSAQSSAPPLPAEVIELRLASDPTLALQPGSTTERDEAE